MRLISRNGGTGAERVTALTSIANGKESSMNHRLEAYATDRIQVHTTEGAAV
ncbi:hypothetical protein [Mariniblastus fucicola]|uniref:Uncharacterized protein n=1 Tax=Mariniblastus fucicola TaxID=980251 RepID=A0A5B9PCZ5_9BACT|nr:hypothetical protein [Mariniblastus fucicola]QEG24228.1 hypothetical protein MFFC18_41450 [Mariniblastus fucicola]